MHLCAVGLIEHYVFHRCRHGAAGHVLQGKLHHHGVVVEVGGVEGSFQHCLVGGEGVVVPAIAFGLCLVAYEHLQESVGTGGLAQLDAVAGIVVDVERRTPQLHVAPVARQADTGGQAVGTGLFAFNLGTIVYQNFEVFA